jgi:hypothetical protein
MLVFISLYILRSSQSTKLTAEKNFYIFEQSDEIYPWESKKVNLNPVKNPMFTRAIFIRPDSELIRESVCACAKLFVNEESTWYKSNRGRTKTLTDSIRTRHNNK